MFDLKIYQKLISIDWLIFINQNQWNKNSFRSSILNDVVVASSVPKNRSFFRFFPFDRRKIQRGTGFHRRRGRSQRESAATVEKERQEEERRKRSGARPINFLDKDALRGPFFSRLGPKAPRQFHGPFHRAAVFNFSIPAFETGHDLCAIPRQEIHGCPKDSQNRPTYSYIYIHIILVKVNSSSVLEYCMDNFIVNDKMIDWLV